MGELVLPDSINGVGPGVGGGIGPGVGWDDTGWIVIGCGVGVGIGVWMPTGAFEPKDTVVGRLEGIMVGVADGRNDGIDVVGASEIDGEWLGVSKAMDTNSTDVTAGKAISIATTNVLEAMSNGSNTRSWSTWMVRLARPLAKVISCW